jgi:pilus assembly protein Flp/PilA
MTMLFARFLADENGATAIEYGLIASLISIALIAAATTVGQNISNTFAEIAGNVQSTR